MAGYKAWRAAETHAEPLAGQHKRVKGGTLKRLEATSTADAVSAVVCVAWASYTGNERSTLVGLGGRG